MISTYLSISALIIGIVSLCQARRQKKTMDMLQSKLVKQNGLSHEHEYAIRELAANANIKVRISD